MDAELENGSEVILKGNTDYWTEGRKMDLRPWEVSVVDNQAAIDDRLRSALDKRGWFVDEQKPAPVGVPRASRCRDLPPGRRSLRHTESDP